MILKSLLAAENALKRGEECVGVALAGQLPGKEAL